MRTHRWLQIPVIRMRSCNCFFFKRVCRTAYQLGAQSAVGILSDRHNPVVAYVEGQALAQSFDERGSVLVEERHEPDGSLLGMTVREGTCTRVKELTAQRLVAPFCSLDELAVKRLQILLHPTERRFRGPFERRIESWNSLDQFGHLRVQRP